MGCGGHVLDKINRMKANDALKNRKRERQKSFHSSKSKNIYSFNIKALTNAKELSEEERQRIILKLRKEKRIAGIKKEIAFLISVTVLSILIYILLLT